MRLWALIALVLSWAVPAVAAEQAGEMVRIGWLGPGNQNTNADNREAFLRGMHDLGYVEGRDFVLELRFWGNDDRTALASSVEDLVRLKVNAIVTPGTPAVRVVQTATHSIPIVMTAVGDPVASGFVDSLARPGGNATGLTVLSKDLAAKRLELMKDAVPSARRTAILEHPDNPVHGSTIKDMESAALPLGLALQVFGARRPEDFERAFTAMTDWSADAVIILDEGIFVANRTVIATLGARRRLPLACGFREMTEAGCLLSYAASLSDINYRAAGYVVKILKGANPAELPVEQPTKFELVINLKTAKALGLVIPPSLLTRADQVIE
ncbi:MAG TPA: ABC transporter substrate-binding protein [Alphaproteobacteria bacterium]